MAMLPVLLSAVAVSCALVACGSDAAVSSRDAGITGAPDSGEDRLGQRDAGDAARPAPADVFDVEAALPRFLGHDVIELGKIARVSRFRSGIGHDYADNVETCRSMKHYFQPRSGIDWASVRITAPTAGTLVRIDEEWAVATPGTLENWVTLN